MAPAMTTRFLVLAAAAAALASCASGPRGPAIEVVNRALANAPGEAQPSKIVAAEVAFEQAAVADGQWTAFRRFAAPGAVMHLPSGLTDAGEWLKGRKDPAASVRWNPRGVWVSCDAKLAVSRGRFEQPDGMVGTFVTVWQRQGDGSHRWVYDGGAPDDPQPEPVRTDLPPEELIVVEAIDTIQGHVADCPKPGAPPLPPPPTAAYAQGSQIGQAISPDGTLRAIWVHGPAGERSVDVAIWSDGAWQRGMNQPLPGPIGQ